MTYLVFYVLVLLLIAFLIGAFLMAYLVPSRIPKSYTDAAPATATPKVAAAPAPSPKAATPPPAPKPAPPKAPEPTPAPAAPLMAAAAPASPAPTLSGDDLASAGEADKVGKRPGGLSAPMGGTPDKLTRVKGIGPVNEKRLHNLGIYHFSQIAAWGSDEIAWVNTFLTFKGRIEREDWVGQAKVFTAETA